MATTVKTAIKRLNELRGARTYATATEGGVSVLIADNETIQMAVMAMQFFVPINETIDDYFKLIAPEVNKQLSVKDFALQEIKKEQAGLGDG